MAVFSGLEEKVSRGVGQVKEVNGGGSQEVIKGPALNADQAEKGGVRKRGGTIKKEYGRSQSRE